ncbi:hypothetical protein BGY98DRAFT_636650 [Russula aff. rugulosa BPL654]|nr:hypothetical protein BGY98DRAFT_636650 [Russula aff. rugulosa BPL654]
MMRDGNRWQLRVITREINQEPKLQSDDRIVSYRQVLDSINSQSHLWAILHPSARRLTHTILIRSPIGGGISRRPTHPICCRHIFFYSNAIILICGGTISALLPSPNSEPAGFIASLLIVNSSRTGFCSHAASPPLIRWMDGSWIDRWIERCRLHAWTTGHISPVRTRHGLCVVPGMRGTCLAAQGPSKVFSQTLGEIGLGDDRACLSNETRPLFQFRATS